MSLDFSLNEERTVEVFDLNITHNLSIMASHAGVYNALWHSEGKKASELLPELIMGLACLAIDKESLLDHTPPNGWGDYDGLVRCVRDAAKACIEHPDAVVEVSR